MKINSFNNSIFWPVFLILFLFLAAVLPVFLLDHGLDEEFVIEDRDEWKVYINEDFGFKIEHPSDWQVVDLSKGDPVSSFHILPPEVDIEGREIILPHSNISNVSIYPEGYPNEDFIGQFGISVVSLGEKVKEAFDFYLLNDEDWATKIVPEADILEWSEDGFLWSRASVDDYEVFCFDNEERIKRDLCDPKNQGHKVKHEGSVNRKERIIQIEILESFSFIN